jgi:hypothetical protein
MKLLQQEIGWKSLVYLLCIVILFVGSTARPPVHSQHGIHNKAINLIKCKLINRKTKPKSLIEKNTVLQDKLLAS